MASLYRDSVFKFFDVVRKFTFNSFTGPFCQLRNVKQWRARMMSNLIILQDISDKKFTCGTREDRAWALLLVLAPKVLFQIFYMSFLQADLIVIYQWNAFIDVVRSRRPPVGLMHSVRQLECIYCFRLGLFSIWSGGHTTLIRKHNSSLSTFPKQNLTKTGVAVLIST
jgi:hypothetical protein